MSPPALLTTTARAIAGAVVVLGAMGAAAAIGSTGPGADPGVWSGHPAVGSAAGAGPTREVGGQGAARAGPSIRAPARGEAVARAEPGVRAPAVGEVTDRPGPRWRWPLAPTPGVARPFRAPASDWGAGHRGLDLVTRPGALVLAVEGGLVTHAGTVAGRGTVSVRHADGLVSTYEPVRPGVAVGDEVSVGDGVGAVDLGSAASHCGARACLHLGARRGAAYLDPWPLLVGGELALLPLR